MHPNMYSGLTIVALPMLEGGHFPPSVQTTQLREVVLHSGLQVDGRFSTGIAMDFSHLRIFS